jgi:nucleoid DNA-binding protein
MKIELLIKKIASEFNAEETEVSEYFDSIFESLAAAFVKNKNVNISDFGKFKIKTHPGEEGEKQRTVFFSPVKKFADEVNYNFGELPPVQIRVLDDKFLKGKLIEEVFSGDEFEDIILIDFNEQEIPYESVEKEAEVSGVKEESAWEEILIPEETIHDGVFSKEEQAVKEDILIPEGTEHEPVFSKEEQAIKEDILIPEGTEHEPVFSKEEQAIKENILIPEEPKHEIPFEKIPEDKKEEPAPVIPDLIAEPAADKNEEIFTEKDKILVQLGGVKFPEIILPDFEEIIETKKLTYKDKKIISDAAIVIKPVIPEEKAVKETPKEEAETIIFKASDKREEEKKEEVILPHAVFEKETEEIPAVIPDEIFAESTEPVLPEKEEAEVQSPPDDTKEDKKEEVIKPQDIFIDDLVTEESTDSIPEEKEIFPEEKKSNLQLEAELLKMLDERRKILEEIKKLEEVDTDDLIDISKVSAVPAEDKPRLIEDSTLDVSRQNIFVNDEDKDIESLLKSFESESGIPEETEAKNKTAGEEGIKEGEETSIPEEPKTEGDLINEKLYTGEDINELEGLMGSLYGSDVDKINLPEPKEVEPHHNNLEMKVFDRLLEEPGNEEKISDTEKIKTEEEEKTGSTSLSELESMFVNFRTEKTEDDIIKGEKKETPINAEPEVMNTEAIKTYDDIFNLLEPNGKKKEEKKSEPVKETPGKKYPPYLKILIPAVIILMIIIVSIIFYGKVVYKKESKQLPVTVPIDSTKVAASDSVVFADTNKVKVTQEEDVVYDENDIIIKEGENGFYIQLGQYENQFELAKKIKELKNKKIFPGYEEVTLEGKQVYRLRIGPYKTLREAKAIIPKL